MYLIWASFSRAAKIEVLYQNFMNLWAKITARTHTLHYWCHKDFFLNFVAFSENINFKVCFWWLKTSKTLKCPAMAVVWIFFYSNLFSTYCGAPVLNEPLFSGNIIIIPAAGKSPACKYFQMKRQYSVFYLVGGHKVPLNYIQFRLEVKNLFMFIINSLP